MTHVYFHRANSKLVVLDPRGTDVEDLVEAHQMAIQVIQEYVTTLSADDWRAWTLHVSDEDGEEIFLMPFSYVLGRLH